MKRIFLLLLTIIHSVFVFSQLNISNHQVDWGEEIKVSKKESLLGLVGAQDGNVFITKSKFAGMFSLPDYKIQRINKSLNPDLEKQITLEVNDNKSQYLQTIQLADNLFSFSTYRDKKTDLNTLFCEKISTASLANSDRKN